MKLTFLFYYRLLLSKQSNEKSFSFDSKLDVKFSIGAILGDEIANLANLLFLLA
jgi:hypothetical protein